jgi:lysozyme
MGTGQSGEKGYEKIEVTGGEKAAAQANQNNGLAIVQYLDKSGKLLITKDGLEMVKHFEGCYLEAYVDPVGVATIAYGRIVYPNGKKVKLGDKCTKEEAEAWLLEDLYAEGAKYVRAFLNDEIENKLTPFQFSSLVDFTFNRGAGRLREYVVPYLNSGNFNGAIKSLVSVNWAGPKKKYLVGLDRRRWAEARMFNGGNWTDFNTVPKFLKFKSNGHK